MKSETRKKKQRRVIELRWDEKVVSFKDEQDTLIAGIEEMISKVI